MALEIDPERHALHLARITERIGTETVPMFEYEPLARELAAAHARIDALEAALAGDDAPAKPEG